MIRVIILTFLFFVSSAQSDDDYRKYRTSNLPVTQIINLVDNDRYYRINGVVKYTRPYVKIYDKSGSVVLDLDDDLMIMPKDGFYIDAYGELEKKFFGQNQFELKSFTYIKQ